MGLIKETFSEFADDDCPRMAAALAYYTVFALPPMLVIILLIAGMVVSPDRVMEVLQQQMSEGAASQVQTMVESANQTVAGGLSAALILSILGLIFSATGAFAQFQKALNAAWQVEPDPEQSGFAKVKSLAWKRLLSLGMILVVAFLLVVALVASGMISAFTDSIAAFLGDYGLSASVSTVLVWVTDAVLSILILWLLFAALFKVLPDARVRWKDVRVGALVTSVLFVIGKLAIGWYIGRSDPGSAFGAAGALAVILLFVYYAAMIVLLGAEFTQVWARRHGHTLRPAKDAVKVVERKEYERGGDGPSTGSQGAAARAR